MGQIALRVGVSDSVQSAMELGCQLDWCFQGLTLAAADLAVYMLIICGGNALAWEWVEILVLRLRLEIVEGADNCTWAFKCMYPSIRQRGGNAQVK
jgi:hypothetical protein